MVNRLRGPAEQPDRPLGAGALGTLRAERSRSGT